VERSHGTFSVERTDVRLVSYVLRKHHRPSNWGNDHVDHEQPILIFVLILVGILVTGSLIALYWPSQNKAWYAAGKFWEQGFPYCLISPVIVVLWLGGLLVCGAPAIALVAPAVCSS
jgi:hypothetical protein